MILLSCSNQNKGHLYRNFLSSQTDNGEDELFSGEATTTEGSGDNNLTVVDKTVNSKSIQSYMSGMYAIYAFFF